MSVFEHGLLHVARKAVEATRASFHPLGGLLYRCYQVALRNGLGDWRHSTSLLGKGR
jgi:hypothetical protein